MTTIGRRDLAVLAACIGGTAAAYQLARWISSIGQRSDSDWVPVGRIQELYIFPIKSGKAKPVFSLFCDRIGATHGENKDRAFLVTDADAHFFTGRVKPQLLLVESDVRDGVLHLSFKGETAQIDLGKVLEENNILPATLFQNQRQDGLDCGAAAAEFFSKVVGEDAKLVMFVPGNYTERTVKTSQDWWNNNPVPKRTDDAAYPDLTPYMVSTQASLDELNKRLGVVENPLTNVRFRANIVVDGCPAWDEDKWAEIRFGETPDSRATEMQCIRPCDRCIMTTIDPQTGQKNPEQEPLKTLREFRMPEGRMLTGLGPSPIFGVHTVQNRDGFVHRGQTVWVRYKKSGAF